MQLEQLEAMWAEDCKIDETNLARESTRIPELHSKYYKLYIRSATKASKYKSDLKELERIKTEYYNGSMAEEDLKHYGWKQNPLKILKSDIAKYIESDKDIINLCLKIDYQVSYTKFLEDIIRQINNRNFIIKNIIDYMKFTHGGY
jgi:hypothetical protein